MRDAIFVTLIAMVGLGLSALIAMMCVEYYRMFRGDPKAEPMPTVPAAVPFYLRPEYPREQIESLEARLARALQDVDTERTINRTGAKPMFTMADALAEMAARDRHRMAVRRISNERLRSLPWAPVRRVA